MKECLCSESFLSYLSPPSAGSYIEICHGSTDPSAAGKEAFPFLLIHDSDALTRLMEARFRTDSGSTIKNLFLLLQRDDYSIPRNQSMPVTNPMIESLWQESFEYYSRHNDDASLITLSRQMDPQGALLPFRSLFYCRSKGVFFHPPCPGCGRPLDQCCDDELLAGLGLKTFSGSASRFLFCASCMSSGTQPAFYAYEPGSLDPPIVKGRAELIRRFGDLVKNKIDSAGLPCLECPESGDCYGVGNESPARIIPFSFYPFRVLIFDAMSLSASDFIALASGASMEELQAHLERQKEAGRINHLGNLNIRELRSSKPFIFRDDPKFFLEVLYLKLSFLGQVVLEAIDALEGSSAPYPMLSLDRTWTRLTNRGTLLPFFWNFEIKHIDLIREPFEIQVRPKLPPTYGFHYLGVLWFETLLVNASQDRLQVSKAIEEAYDRIFSSKGAAFEDLPDRSGPAFAPGNILWNPEELSLGDRWQELWAGCLAMGWSLFRAALEGREAWSGGDFRQRLENLREEIIDELFEAEVGPRAEQSGARDAAIHGVLTRVIGKWKEIESRTRELPRATPEETIAEKTMVSESISPEEETLPLRFPSAPDEGPIAETIIVSPRKPEEIPSRQAPPGEASPAGLAAGPDRGLPSGKEIEPEATLPHDFRLTREEEEDVPETVIISPKMQGKGPGITPPPPPPGAGGAGPKIPPPPGEPVAAGESIHPGHSPEQTHEEDIPETVIISPTKPGEIRGVAPGRREEPPMPPREAEPGARPRAPEADLPHEKSRGQKREEDIPETVIISPGKGRKYFTPAPSQTSSIFPPSRSHKPTPADADEAEDQQDKKPEPEDDEFLSETVILNPNKDKNKK